MRPVREWPTKRAAPQPSSSKEAARVHGGPCPARGYSLTEVRHRRCVNLSVRRLGGPRTPPGAIWLGLELPFAWMDQERRAGPAFLPGPNTAPNDGLFSLIVLSKISEPVRR